jgi:hypothetical protein
VISIREIQVFWQAIGIRAEWATNAYRMGYK